MYWRSERCVRGSVKGVLEVWEAYLRCEGCSGGVKGVRECERRT